MRWSFIPNNRVCVYSTMAPKRKAELTRESRKRKRDNELRYSDEFFLFIRHTPFCSNTTDSEKFEAFLRLRDSNAPKPASNAEKCKKYREVDKLRKRDARLKTYTCTDVSVCSVDTLSFFLYKYVLCFTPSK